MRGEQLITGTPSTSSGGRKADDGKVKLMSREITTKCSRDLARAETRIHGGEDPKKTPGQGEEQEKGKDLLLLLPAHVWGLVVSFWVKREKTIREPRALQNHNQKRL